VGLVARVAETSAGREFVVGSPYEGLAVGESIACDGACLTVLRHGPGWFAVAAVVARVGRAALGNWAAGRRINLERALRAGDRLGGHRVQGHVDAVGEIVSVEQRDDARLIDVRVPPEVAELLVPHGSIAVDGVSLTVNALPAPDVVGLSIIEHTLRHTTLGDRAPGDGVHVEGDVIGKYVRRLVTPYLSGSKLGGDSRIAASSADG